MSRVSVDNLGAIGMMFDRKPHEIPPEAFSSLRNVRCFDRSLFSTYGYTSIMGVPLHIAYMLLSTLDNADSPLWAYTGLAKVSATDGSTHQDITRLAGDYTGTDAALWNGGNFGGITILNNGVDVPQAWIVPALGTRLVNLANWPASTFAKVVRPLGRFLVALDVTVSGTRKSTLVKWSDEADIGTVPSTWDPADATKKAGEWPLLETEGPCIDLVPMGERGIIYKSDAIHSMTRIAGRFVWAFKKLPFNTGILAQRCAAEWRSKHYVATPDDVVVHDGLQMDSILDDRMQRWYSGRVDQTNAFRSFVAMNHAENELWVCIPESGNTFPNVALIVNLKDGTTTTQDLSGFSHIDWGRPPGVSQVYDSWNIPFDQMVGYFGQSVGNAARKRMIAVAPLAERNQALQSEDLSTTWTNTANTITTNVEGVADKIVPTAVNTQHYLFQTYTKLAAEIQVWTLSMKAKADGYGFAAIYGGGPATNRAHLTFDLSTGAVATTPVLTGVATVIAAGMDGTVDANGYRRIYVTMQTGADATIDFGLAASPSAGLGFGVFTGDGTSGIRVKEMQLRRGTLGAYQGTTTLRATTGFFLMDSGTDFDGVAFISRAERLGSSVIGQTRLGEPKSDISAMKLMTRFWPKVQLLSGSSLAFYCGMQKTLNAAVNWQGPFAFNPTTDEEVFPDLEGRLMAFALQTGAREVWRWDGYDVEVTKIGQY